MCIFYPCVYWINVITVTWVKLCHALPNRCDRKQVLISRFLFELKNSFEITFSNYLYNGWHCWHISQILHGHLRLNVSFLDRIFFWMPFNESICNISLTSAGDGDFSIAYRKSELSDRYFFGNFPNFSNTYFKEDKRRWFHVYTA